MFKRCNYVREPEMASNLSGSGNQGTITLGFRILATDCQLIFGEAFSVSDLAPHPVCLAKTL